MKMKTLKAIALSCIVVVAVTGCQTTRQNAMTGETETNAKTKGAITGCLGGAIIGAIANDGKGAAIGCAGGGAVGFGVGAYMDNQEEVLRQELVNSGVQVKRVGDQIQLVLDSDITFASGKADVSPAIAPSLRSIAKVMNEFDETMIVVSGHTDSTGSEEYNQRLSEIRAQSVQTELNRAGVGRNRTSVEGYGEMKPLCDNKTAAGRSCNRRVELMIVPMN